MTVQANGTFGGDGQVIGNVSNAGVLLVGRAATGSNFSDFIINGNYVGNGGNVALNTVLAGEGAKNINGIQVINVGGTSAGVFTLNGAKMSDIQNNGSLVKQNGNNNLQTRLGAKLSNDTLLGKDKSRILTTYMDLNWIQNTRLPGVNADGQGVQQTGSRHLVEVKVGAEGKLSNNLSVWGNLTQQIGQKGYDDKAAMLGVKYTF